MFCPVCGTRLPDDAAFCSMCGQRTGTGVVTAPPPMPEPAPAPNPTQGYAPTPTQGYAPNPTQGYAPNPTQGYAPTPTQGYAPNPAQGYAPNPTPAPAPAPAPTQTERPTTLRPTSPVSRGKYFSSVAPTGVRVMKYIAMLLGILCILMIYLSADTTVNGSLFDTPIVTFLDAEGAEEVEWELEMALDEIEEYEDYDELRYFLEDMLGEDIYDIDEDDYEEIRDMIDPLSLSGMVEVAQYVGVYDSEVVEIIDTAITAIKGISVFLMILTALGVLFKKTWLMVLSCVFSAGFILITGGVAYFAVAMVGFITAAILYSRMNSRYSAYKESFRRAY